MIEINYRKLIFSIIGFVVLGLMIFLSVDYSQNQTSLSSLAQVDEEKEENPKTFTIPYKTVQGKALNLTVYQPFLTPYNVPPVILYFHGGAWVERDPHDPLPLIAQQFRQRGFTVIDVSYRLGKEGRFPAPIEDAKDALHWVTEQASHYGWDAKKVGVMGFSSGGYIALMTALTSEEHIQYGIAFAAPTYFPKEEAKYSEWQFKVVSSFLGGTPSHIPKVYDQASPLFHLKGKKVPFLLFQGKEDGVVPAASTQLFLQQAKKERFPVEMVTVQGLGHQWKEVHLNPSLYELSETAFAFIQNILNEKKKN